MDREFWNDSYKEDPSSVHVADRILEAEIQDLAPGAALDLGCGVGLNALMLAENGWSVLGVDWAEHAVKLANEAAEARGLDARFVVGDITSWQPEIKFDLVINTFSLPGGDQNQLVLDTAQSALRHGGTLIIVEWDVSMARVWDFDENDLTSPDKLAARLSGLELERAEVRRLDGVFAEEDMRASAGTSANIVFLRARKI